MIENIYNILSKCRFSLESEKELQGQIQEILNKNNIVHRREVILDDKNIIDFLVGDIGIEVKIKGGKKDIYKQIERYSHFKEINKIILLTSRSLGMVREINGKNIHLINISKAWL